MENKELSYIFLHELIHYRQKDIFCDGAGEDDKPLSSVSDGSVKFVLVRKDSYSSVGPFDNMKTLMEDVADIYRNAGSDNKNSVFEMELDRNYDDTDPFINERLFCVSISLDNILKENEYVIRFVGTKINYAKIKVVFESALVRERERPRS